MRTQEPVQATTLDGNLTVTSVSTVNTNDGRQLQRDLQRE